jgi:hypothetical protein
MKKIALLSIAALLAAAGAAQASVSVQVTAWQLNDKDGNDPAQKCKTIAVIDKDDDGIAGFDLTNASDTTFIFDADDVILNGDVSGGEWSETTGDTEESGLKDYLVSGTYSLNLGSGIDEGDHVFLFYFPDLTASATQPGQNTYFGVLDLGPLPANTGSLAYNNTGLDVRATHQTVPEPATMVLLAIGGGLMAIRRRKRAQAAS